jgi:hypothetical protein
VDTSGAELDAAPYESARPHRQDQATLKKDRFETRQYDWAAVPDFEITSEDVFRWLTEHKGTIPGDVFATLALGAPALFMVVPDPAHPLHRPAPDDSAKALGDAAQYGQDRLHRLLRRHAADDRADRPLVQRDGAWLSLSGGST